MSVSDAMVNLGISAREAVEQVRLIWDRMGEAFTEERFGPEYDGPCVCDVCPCAIVVQHPSGLLHCWPCEHGSHAMPDELGVN